MKKIIYTAALLTFLAVAGQAQTAKPTPQEPKKQTATPAPEKREEKATGSPAKSGTRMAITEKGVPASKATTTTSKKEEKTASPGQPAPTPAGKQ